MWHLKYWGQWYKHAMESKDTYIIWIFPPFPTGQSPFLCSTCLLATYMPWSSTHGGQHPFHPSNLSSLLLLNPNTLWWFANDSYYGLWRILTWKPILLIHTPLFKNRSSLQWELSLALCGDLEGWDETVGGRGYIHRAGSLPCTAETNITL